LKTGPFDFKTQIDHLKTGLVRFSDGDYWQNFETKKKFQIGVQDVDVGIDWVNAKLDLMVGRV
jgi:hypothetical protein